MKMIHEDLHPKKPVGHVDSDSDGETNVPLDDVARVVEQFEHENEGNVNIPRMTTDDPWLNKPVRNCTFIGQTDNLNPNLQGRFLLEVEDLDDKQVEYKFEAKHNMSYPSFNPDTPWNECKPVLRMRFESPQSLKPFDCLLWDVSEGKCAGLKGKKPKTVDDNEYVSLGQCHRAKQCVLYDHEGGLVDHYSKLWQYRQAILDTNPGFTCVLENEVNDEDGKLYFSRYCSAATYRCLTKEYQRDLGHVMYPFIGSPVGSERYSPG
ncbi:hypothetical protein Tco_0672950 [Tanacetum coccineum]